MPDTEPSFRTERYRFLKKKASLDLLSVDEELQEIAVLVQDAGECVALANEIRDASKLDLEVAEAQEFSKLRNTKQENGKYTSDYSIPKLLSLSEEVQQAEIALSAARLDAALWATVMNALMTKSSAIRTAADLISSGYLTTDFLRATHRKAIRNVQVKET